MKSGQPKPLFKNRQYCDEHRPVQHRDGRKPWCDTCGREDDTNKVLTDYHPSYGPNAAYRYLPDDRVIVAEPLFAGAMRIHVGPSDCFGSDASWDYQADMIGAAIAALASWDGNGEPEGWFRDNKTKRKRVHGDPAKEYEDGSIPPG